jgi:hypothetical protein
VVDFGDDQAAFATAGFYADRAERLERLEMGVAHA